MVWYGTEWYGDGMVWYSMVSLCILCFVLLLLLFVVVVVVLCFVVLFVFADYPSPTLRRKRGARNTEVRAEPFSYATLPAQHYTRYVHC